MELDRFIGQRQTNYDEENHQLFSNLSSSSSISSFKDDGTKDELRLEQENESTYQYSLSKALLSQPPKMQKILHLNEAAPEPPKEYSNKLNILFAMNKVGGGAPINSGLSKSHATHIPSAPLRILDAPQLVDDFYTNVLDWSSEDIVGVGLTGAVYLWGASSGTIQKLSDEPDGVYVSSLKFSQDGSFVAVGNSNNVVHIYDSATNKKIRTIKGHTGRVSSLAWNLHILTTGSRDKTILNHDVRIKNSLMQTLSGHDQEVCGLGWSSDGQTLASGGNDNLLKIWTPTKSIDPKFTFNCHQAAVKALAWCPWQNNLIASGGGTADRKLVFHNTSTGKIVNQIDTKSQVCSIIWSKTDRELVTSHGFSKFQLCIWKYPHLQIISELYGHTSRVLHMAQSPDGSTICSAGDETLRFWKIFAPPKQENANRAVSENTLFGKKSNMLKSIR